MVAKEMCLGMIYRREEGLWKVGLACQRPFFERAEWVGSKATFFGSQMRRGYLVYNGGVIARVPVLFLAFWLYLFIYPALTCGEQVEPFSSEELSPSGEVSVPCVPRIDLPVLGAFRTASAPNVPRISSRTVTNENHTTFAILSLWVGEGGNSICGHTIPVELRTAQNDIVSFQLKVAAPKLETGKSLPVLRQRRLPCQQSLEFSLEGEKDLSSILPQFGAEKVRDPVKVDEARQSFEIGIRPEDCGKTLRLMSVDARGSSRRLGDYQIEGLGADFQQLADNFRLVEYGLGIILCAIVCAAWWIRAGRKRGAEIPSVRQSEIYRILRQLAVNLAKVEEMQHEAVAARALSWRAAAGSLVSLNVPGDTRTESPQTRSPRTPSPGPTMSPMGEETQSARLGLSSDSFAGWFNSASWSDRGGNLPWELHATKVLLRPPNVGETSPSLVPSMSGELMLFEGEPLGERGYIAPALDLRRPWPNTLLKRWFWFFDYECEEPRRLERPALVTLRNGGYELVEKGRLIE